MANDPTPGTAEALAAGHAKSQAVVQGAIKPEALAPKPSEEQAPAGKYRLLASVWNRIVSGPNEPRRFVKHYRGAVVDLESEDAERMLRHGVVEPTTDEQAASAAAQTEPPVAQATAVNDVVGQQPIKDPENPSGPGAA
jgi:hypothetical protein